MQKRTHTHASGQAEEGSCGGGGADGMLRACFNVDPIKTGSDPATYLYLIALRTQIRLVRRNMKLRDLRALPVLRDLPSLRCVFPCTHFDVFVVAGALQIAVFFFSFIRNMHVAPPCGWGSQFILSLYDKPPGRILVPVRGIIGIGSLKK